MTEDTTHMKHHEEIANIREGLQVLEKFADLIAEPAIGLLDSDVGVDDIPAEGPEVRAFMVGTMSMIADHGGVWHVTDKIEAVAFLLKLFISGPLDSAREVTSGERKARTGDAELEAVVTRLRGTGGAR